ncbi:hypothetical protein JYU34_018342 [Plutella xylostella]|uniref:Uncharacterized protein n=1 Tax=Plutella xylostella TaxID=51655 RepID=A0ABQ7PYQ5_PLUXY|nr:hypothetical protein JYU34_018342 [Plutella xylostella]
MSLLNRRSSDVTAAIALIQQAAARGSAPARLALAWARVYGEGGAVDVEAARREFEELVKEGHADAHSGLGFMYATGTGVPVSQARALVHYTAGALAGSTYSQMALAYRYWAGHTLRASCHDALTLYMKVAAKVASSVSLSGGPAIQRVRLLEEAEGGAGGTLDTDLIEYYQLLAEKGDVQAQGGTRGHGGARWTPTSSSTTSCWRRRETCRRRYETTTLGGHAGARGGTLDTDLIEYYQLLAEKGDVQAQPRQHAMEHHDMHPTTCKP